MTSALLLSALVANASSHREAPAIALDPAADLTDVYAFINPNDSTKLDLIMNVNPLEDPGGGPNYHFFDDDVLYVIHVDNEGDGVEDISFNFKFTTTYQHPGDFLYNLGDITNSANLNMVQTVSVTRYDDGVAKSLFKNKGVAPVNVGTQSDPTGGYDPYSVTPGAIDTAYIYKNGTTSMFAGPRQEGFYVDLGRTFDLLNVGGNDPGVNRNTLLGYNVSTMAIEVDTRTMTKDGLTPTAGSNSVIAVWATASRRAKLTRSASGADLDVNSGGWVQVSRLGSPLVNEVVIGVQDKNKFNASNPTGDAQFLSYVTDPILLPYMTAVLGVPDPGCYNAGFGVGCREDLVEVFLTGHPALGTQPASFALGGAIPGEPNKFFAPFEALRINLANPVSGFPNGRYVSDDVVDTALSAEAGLLINGATVPDGVDSTGLTYLDAFPFLGDPWAGDNHPVNNHDF